MARLSKSIERRYSTMKRRLVPSGGADHQDDDCCSLDSSTHSTVSTISVNTRKRFKNAMESIKSMSSFTSRKRRSSSKTLLLLHQRSSQKVVKSVSFAPAAQVYSTLGYDDYSESERAACWFEREDYERILEKCHKLIRKNKTWESKKGDKSSKLCTRGLERMTELGYEVSRYNRMDAYEAVLRQQQQERESGEDEQPSEDMIARLYSDVTARSQKRALRLAEEDAASASRYLGRSLSSSTVGTQ